MNGNRRQSNPGKGIIMNVVRTINNWINYHRTLNELGRMNNRALQDIGVSRDAIPTVARGVFR